MASSAPPTPDASIWRAIAGAAVQIPPPNSYVYYFPQGHLEQSRDAAARNSNTALGRSYIPCRVLSVGLFYHPQSEQPFAKILLQPAINTWQQQQHHPLNNDSESDVVSYAKILTPSDANNGGGFSVPRSCAESIFPRLDFSADPPVQNLIIKDARGNAWGFRHIYRGTPRRHLLTTGWSKFVNSKRLIAGDSVVFMRKKRSAASSSDRHHQLDELFVGIRRAGKSEVSGGGAGAGNEAMEAMEKAAKGLAFEVVYYPRTGSPDFVVNAARVDKSSQIEWSRGMRVRMEVETDDSTRTASSDGTIMDVSLAESGPWRMLQVTWDEPDIVSNVERVSPWEVEYVPREPYLHPMLPPAKKIKASSPDHHQQQQQQGVQIRDQIDNPYQTFTQLLMKCIESDDDDVDDHFGQQGRNNVGGSSFRLFGQNIETCETSQGGSAKRK